MLATSWRPSPRDLLRAMPVRWVSAWVAGLKVQLRRVSSSSSRFNLAYLRAAQCGGHAEQPAQQSVTDCKLGDVDPQQLPEQDECDVGYYPAHPGLLCQHPV